MERNVQQELKELIESHNVVLFMKGTKRMPQCGFSAAAIQMLGELGASFVDVNVLADLEVREGIKQYSDWPTIPQLYVNGTFVGGSDIMRTLYDSGELAALFQQQKSA